RFETSANDVIGRRKAPYFRRTSTRVSMAVPRPLSKKLREALGPDSGEDLVTWLQEMRAEHDEKLASIHGDFAELRHEMQASESRVVERIRKLEVTLDDRIHGVDERTGRVAARVAEGEAVRSRRRWV